MKGSELKKIRETLNLTQAELAEKLDVKQNTVYRWEADILPISRVVELALKTVEREIRFISKTKSE